MEPIERKTLKRDIQKSFGSLANFSRVTKIPYRRLVLILDFKIRDEKSISNVVKQFEKRKNDKDVYGKISETDRANIRLCILTAFNSYTDFCKKHNDFDVVYITNVVKGNLSVATKKYIKLVEILKKHYNL